MQDVAGDLLFLLESNKYTYKEWVGDLSVPYITFFVVAAGASIATVVGKIVLVVQKSRSRGRARARAVAPAIALARSVHEQRLAELRPRTDCPMVTSHETQYTVASESASAFLRHARAHRAHVDARTRS